MFKVGFYHPSGLTVVSAVWRVPSSCEIGMRHVCLLGPINASMLRQYEPGTRTGYTTNTDPWILRLWGSGGACNLRGQPRYVLSFYSHFRIIHSFILSAQMAFFYFLVHTPTATHNRIHLTLQLSLTCKDSSSNPWYPHLHIHPIPAWPGSMSWWLLLTTRSLSRNSQSHKCNTFDVSCPTSRSISSFPSLSPCIPPSYPSSYRTPLPNSTNASSWCQRQCLAPTPPLQHPHLRHLLPFLFIDGHTMSPFSLPSVGPCYQYLSLNIGVPYIKLVTLKYEDVTAYNKCHRWDQRPGLHAYQCQYKLECTSVVLTFLTWTGKSDWHTGLTSQAESLTLGQIKVRNCQRTCRIRTQSLRDRGLPPKQCL